MFTRGGVRNGQFIFQFLDDRVAGDVFVNDDIS